MDVESMRVVATSSSRERGTVVGGGDLVRGRLLGRVLLVSVVMVAEMGQERKEMSIRFSPLTDHDFTTSLTRT